MVKIKNKNIFFLLLVVLLIALSSCAKPECKTSADCISKKCFLSKCENKKCSFSLQKNCCGNNIKEDIENGKPGNKCTCTQDYGKCEGKGKIKIGSRTEDAVYAKYLCNEANECVFGVDRKDVSPQNFPDSINVGSFKSSLVIRYNKPFDISRDSFEFRITLDDAGKDLVFPVKITRIKLLYAGQYSRQEQLIAEKEFDSSLNNIGDQAVLPLILNLNYKPQELEESGSIRYSIDYAYTRQVLSGKAPDGTNTYQNELKRDTFSSPTKQIYFVRGGNG